MKADEIKKGQILYCRNGSVTALFIPYAKTTQSLVRGYKEQVFLGVSIINYGEFIPCNIEQTIYNSPGYKLQFTCEGYQPATDQDMLSIFSEFIEKNPSDFISILQEKNVLKSFCKNIKDNRVKRAIVLCIFRGK